MFNFLGAANFYFSKQLIEMQIVPMFEDLNQGGALKYKIMQSSAGEI